MNAFEEYILREYQLPPSAVCQSFKYSHSTKQCLDKASKVPLINNIINVKIDSYDDKHNLIATHVEKFIDGQIQRKKNNKLINISPAELNNRFAAAKQSIVNQIIAEYNVKLNEIQDKINEVNSYCKADGVIPNRFVNEPIVGTVNVEATANVNKHFEF